MAILRDNTTEHNIIIHLKYPNRGFITVLHMSLTKFMLKSLVLTSCKKIIHIYISINMYHSYNSNI